MWLLNKLRRSVDGSGTQSRPSQTHEAIPISVYTNVLTPNRIPDFFIPPKIMCCPPESPEALAPEHRHRASLPASASDHVICSQNPRARGGRLPGSPKLLSRLAGDTRSLLKSANRHIIQIESADEPVAVGHLVAGTVDVNTNADPQSQTAMSLPYVPKAQTSYGFSTLVESPHTRRKESLFHSDPSSPLTSPNSQRRQGGSHLSPADPNPYRYFSGGDTSDTCSSAESSPFTSPLLTRSASIIRSFTQETKTKRSLGRHSSLSTDECSSADNSPNVQRRRLRCPPSPAFRGLRGAAYRGGGGAGPEVLQREHTVNLHKGGTLRLSTHYDAEAARLRVRVLAAEELYDRQTDIKSINCCVALYLNPGKQQKQRSTIIKNSRNPVFNEDFFFEALTPAQVKSLAMKMKVVNKGTSLKRDVLLGEREVLLRELLSSN
ncbi:hypothetical protein CRUP_034294 [Coryphaenoides rupestris]|nr:hypothetical protein CRUP_034294 [Coryphaenoides rupestris]